MNVRTWLGAAAWVARFVAYIAVVVMVIIAAIMVVRADDEGPIHKHPPQHEKLHSEFYSKWNMPPSRNQSCCNEKDCYPTPIRRDEEGIYWALRREDQKWLKISPLVLEQNQPIEDQIESPDFQSHACIAPPEYADHVYCATIGGAN